MPSNGEGPGVRLRKEPAVIAEAIDQKIDVLESDLANEKVNTGQSPQAAMQTMERARKNEVVKLKNNRTTVNTPPPKGGGFELRLEAGSIGPLGR